MNESSIDISVIPVTGFSQNCSVIRCNSTMKGAFVDPGGDVDEILKAADAMNIEPEKILVTHAHIDHAGAVAELSEKLSIPIEGPHPEDQFWIDALPMQSQMFRLPPARVFTPTRWLHDNDSVQVGELTFQVLHTPGHTPGHVVFFQAQEKIAFVGDVLFAGSIGRTDFPKGDHATLISSIQDKLFPLGDDVTFISGHGAVSTFGQERETNPFVRMST